MNSSLCKDGQYIHISCTSFPHIVWWGKGFGCARRIVSIDRAHF